MVTAGNTSAEHAKFCQDLMGRSGGFINEGSFTPYPYRAAGASVRSSILYPDSIGGVNWGATSGDPRTGYLVVNSQDEASMS